MTLVQELDSYVARTGHTLRHVSRSIGMSQATVSQWRSGSYNGSVAQVDEKIRGFLQRESEKEESQVRRCPFVATSIAKRMHEIARMCHIDNELGVAVTDAGNGKTEAVKAYARKYPDTILIEADQGYTAFALFADLHNLLCTHSGKESLHDMSDQVMDKLRDSGRLIIVDEAENLPCKALDLLRRVYDKAHIGILLTGMPRLEANLRGKRGEFAQLHSRVGVFVKLGGITPKDAEYLCAAFLGAKFDAGIADYAYNRARRNARSLILLLKRAQRLAQVNNTEIDDDIIDKASTILML